MLTLRYIYLLAVACATLSSAAPTIVGARQTTGTGTSPIVSGTGVSPSDPDQPVGPAATQPFGPAPPPATQPFGPDNRRRSNVLGTLRELDSGTNVMDNLDTAVHAPRDQVINLPTLFPSLSQ